MIQILVSVLISCAAPQETAVGATPSAVTPVADLSTRIDAMVNQTARDDAPGAAVTVVQRGKVLHAKGYGLADLKTQTPITPQSSFYLASVSKQFTAAAILMLWEREELALDDSLLDYYPDYPEDWSVITIQHLLTHTSGLPDHFRFADDMVGRTNQDVIHLMKEHGQLDFEPGSEYRYSNSGYVLLSDIVAQVSGLSYHDFMEENVFEPLGMANTLIFDETEPAIQHLAQGHQSQVPQGFKATPYQLYTTGAGGMFSTIEDMARWDRALGSDVLLTKETRAEMFTPRVETGNATHYGYGILIQEHRGRRILQHSGGLPGYNTYLLRCPDADTTVVLLANLSGFADLGQFARDILDLSCGVEPGS